MCGHYFRTRSITIVGFSRCMVVTKRGKQRRAWFPGVAAFLPLLATQAGDEDCGSVCVYVVVAGECETMNQSRIDDWEWDIETIMPLFSS